MSSQKHIMTMQKFVNRDITINCLCFCC